MAEQEKIIAFIIYPGLTTLDIIGPMSIAHAGKPYKGVVVAETKDPFLVEGDLMYFGATHTFDEVPNPYGIVIGGGGWPTIRAMANPAIRNYLRANVESAEFVASVCTGALILAAAGFLEGRKATTHWGYRSELEKLGATYVKQRWVEDGKFITAAGVSAGIDLGLFMVSKLVNVERAKLLQRGIEYDPEPPFGPIDWTGADAFMMDLKDAPESTQAAYREALAERPDLFEKLMA